MSFERNTTKKNPVRYFALDHLFRINEDRTSDDYEQFLNDNMCSDTETLVISNFGNTLIPNLPIYNKRNITKPRFMPKEILSSDDVNYNDLKLSLFAIIRSAALVAKDNGTKIRRVIFVGPTPRNTLNGSEAVASQAVAIDRILGFAKGETLKLISLDEDFANIYGSEPLVIDVLSTCSLMRSLFLMSRVHKYTGALKFKMGEVASHFYAACMHADKIHFNNSASDNYFRIITRVIGVWDNLPDRFHPGLESCYQYLLGEFYSSDIFPPYRNMYNDRRLHLRMNIIQKQGLPYDSNQDIQIQAILRDELTKMVSDIPYETLQELFVVRDQKGKVSNIPSKSQNTWDAVYVRHFFTAMFNSEKRIIELLGLPESESSENRLDDRTSSIQDVSKNKMEIES